MNNIKFIGIIGRPCASQTLGGIGFKDLEKFNEVMLAKQVWRLLTDHTYLFY